jgi:hypothetical protein
MTNLTDNDCHPIGSDSATHQSSQPFLVILSFYAESCHGHISRIEKYHNKANVSSVNEQSKTILNNGTNHERNDSPALVMDFQPCASLSVLVLTTTRNDHTNYY